MKEDVFTALVCYADQLAREKDFSWKIHYGLTDLGRIETFSGFAYKQLVYHLVEAKRDGLEVGDTQQAISSLRKNHETNARRVWDARDDKEELEQAFDVLRSGLVVERDAVMDFAADFATPHGLLAFARDELQHYLDAIYPMDDESGERKQLTITEDNLDIIGDKICDPENGEYYIPNTPHLCVVEYETTKGLLGDGVAYALLKMWWELKGAGDDLIASLWKAERGQIDAAYSKILRLVENDLDYLDGLLTRTRGEQQVAAASVVDAPSSKTTSFSASSEKKPKKRSAPTCGYSPADRWAKALFIAAAKLITDNVEMKYSEAVKLAARRTKTHMIRLMYDSNIYGRSPKDLKHYMEIGYAKAKWYKAQRNEKTGEYVFVKPYTKDECFLKAMYNFSNALPDFMRSKDWKDIGYSGKSKKRKRRTP